MKYETSEETIKFELYLTSDYWDLPPIIDVLVDDEIKFTGEMLQEKNYVTFSHTLAFDKPHALRLKRYNKLPGQCVPLDDGTFKDQLLTLDRVVIDGVDIQNIVQAHSYNEPEYPEPWATLQRNQGIELEKQVLAETVFGHNGMWTLNFTSPFYVFLMTRMDGDIK